MSLDTCCTEDLLEFVQGWIRGDHAFETVYEEAIWLLCKRLQEASVAETIAEAIETGVFRSESMLLAFTAVCLRNEASSHIASILLGKIAHSPLLPANVRCEAMRTLLNRNRQEQMHDTLLSSTLPCPEFTPESGTIPSPPPTLQKLETSTILAQTARNTELPEAQRRIALNILAESSPLLFEQVVKELRVA